MSCYEMVSQNNASGRSKLCVLFEVDSDYENDGDLQRLQRNVGSPWQQEKHFPDTERNQM